MLYDISFDNAKSISGYTNDWYPEVEPVIPRVYHEYISEEFKETLYTEEELGKGDAYFIAQPDTYKVHMYGGAKAQLVQKAIGKTKLVPGSKTTNQVPDLIQVKNTGADPIFVRIHLAIPQALDDASPRFEALYNMLHFNANKETGLAAGAFSWAKEANDGRAAGAFIGSSGWNWYQLTLDGIVYSVYVATLETALEANKVSPDVIHQVYLDAKATPEDIKKVYDEIKTNLWDIRVAVETAVDLNGIGEPFEVFNQLSPVGAHNLFKEDFKPQYVVDSADEEPAEDDEPEESDDPLANS